MDFNEEKWIERWKVSSKEEIILFLIRFDEIYRTACGGQTIVGLIGLNGPPKTSEAYSLLQDALGRHIRLLEEQLSREHHPILKYINKNIIPLIKEYHTKEDYRLETMFDCYDGIFERLDALKHMLLTK